MKTHKEQIEFATELKELTVHHGDLLAKLAEADANDKASILSEMRVVLAQMNVLRDSYMKVSLCWG